MVGDARCGGSNPAPVYSVKRILYACGEELDDRKRPYGVRTANVVGCQKPPVGVGRDNGVKKLPESVLKS